MIRNFRSLLIVLAIGAFASCNGYAVTPEEIIKNYNEEIRLVIVKTIGARDKTVEVVVEDHVLKVLRVNSNMTKSNHLGVSNEATSIASVVSKNIMDKPEYSDILAIRVEYVKRSGAPSDGEIVDSVNFRKNQNGVFELHKT
jgi:hypothetical protein